MDNLRRGLGLIVTIATFCSASVAFDTGSHFDLTRAVLAEHGFTDDAIKATQIENWLTDYYSSAPTVMQSRRDEFAKLHCDNLFTTLEVKNYWAWLINNLKSEMQDAARKDDTLAALTVLGLGLHSVQDFYAHSNWVETHPRLADGSYRTETYFHSLGSSPGLFTGKYPNDRTVGPDSEPVPAGASSHGDYDTGINHDSLIRPRWDEAYVFAYAASHEMVDAMAKWADEARPGFWVKVQQTSVDKDGKKKLDYDIAALRSMSMWLNGKGADGHWKGNKSGSSRFFSAFSTKWVLSDSSPFIRKMKDSDISSAIASNLYANILPPPFPEMPRFSLHRRAISVRTTLVKELQDFGLITSAIKKIGSPDFYSRLTIGSQEFWGRAIQAKRETVDPWWEIYFVDADKETIPIKFSVWDEDNPNPTKDAPFDINEIAGKGTIDLMFNTANGETTGDLTGKFNAPEVAFTSSGARPDKDRAVIKAYVTQYLLK